MIQISSRRKLRELCIQFEENPLRCKFLIHVRCLKLLGHTPLLAEEEDTVDRPGHVPKKLAAEEYDAEFGGVFSKDLPDKSVEEVAEV